MSIEKFEVADKLREIACEIESLVNEARIAVDKIDGFDSAGAEAYIFEQILEHCDNSNPYNQSLSSLANNIEEFEEETINE